MGRGESNGTSGRLVRMITGRHDNVV